MGKAVLLGLVGYPGCFGAAHFASPKPSSLTADLELVAADAVEVFMEGPAWARLEDGIRTTRQVLHGYRGQLALHAPIASIDLASYRPQLRHQAVRLIKAAVRAASQLHARHLVVHPYDDHCPDVDGKRFMRAEQSLSELCDVAEAHGVELLVENITGRGRDPGDLDRFLTLVSDTHPRAHALLDLGHAHQAGWDIPTVVHALGSRLGGIHLSDNHGFEDEHLPVGAGTIPWSSVFQAIKASAPEATWVLECANADLDTLRHQMTRLTELATGAREVP